MHEQMERLYEAARLLRNVEGQSAVASLFNMSAQRLNNWEERGISNKGLLAAQAIIGCDAIWLRDGAGEMARGGQRDATSLADVAELIRLFGECNIEDRRTILQLVKTTAKLSSSKLAIAENKSKV